MKPSPKVIHRILLIAAMVMLIGARLLFVHGDPSDFPADRNISASLQIREALQNYPAGDFGFDTIAGIGAPTPLTPEFPFMRIVGWLAGSLGLNPIIACRVFSVLMSLLTALGVYILGRRIGGACGVVALWFFALAPMSVFIGRSLLPDPIMLAALVWAIVASGAGLPRPPRWAPFGLTALLALACLAKLPAIILAPVAAAGYLSASQYRRLAWLKISAGMLAVYLIVCLWYGLAPWWPFAGLQRISSGTNNLMAATGIAFSPQGLALTANRLILALTWPGAMLALVGWAIAQSRPGQRAWLNTFCILSLFFVLLTIGANTYWAAIALPAGAIMAALAVIEISRFGRQASAILALAAVSIIWIDPGVKRIGQNLVTQPALSALRNAARELGDTGPSIFYGNELDDVAWFTGVPGETWTDPPDLRKVDSWRSFKYFYSNRMQAAEPPAEQLFAMKPVVDTRAGDYIIFKLDRTASLGTPVAAPTTGTLATPIDFGSIRLIALSSAQSEANPGERIALDAVFTKTGPDAAPPISIRFVHADTGEAFPIPPRAGGALFSQWGVPRIQTPDFRTSDPYRIRYEFELPRLMPAGAYAIRLTRGHEETRGMIPVALKVHPLKQNAPFKIDLADAIWLRPTRVSKPAWLGREHSNWMLQSEGIAWFSPHLPAGHYRMAIRGRGGYYGSDPKTRWPILEVHQPGRPLNQKIEFNSPLARTHQIEIDLRGPDDFIRLRVMNPYLDYLIGGPFPLYPHELGSSRTVELLGIEFLPRQ